MFRTLTWALAMAWRDSRRERGRLFLFAVAVAAGVGAVVAVSGFGRSVQKSISYQAKSLLGADMVVSSSAEFTASQERFLNSIGGEQAHEVAFASLVRPAKGGAARLVQVRGIESAFPFYGRIETVPQGSLDGMRSGRGLLADAALISQMGLRIGDAIHIGGLKTEIWGTLTEAPGEGFGVGMMVPRVYMTLPDIYRASLLKGRTMVKHHAYFRLPPDTDVAALVEQRADDFRELELGVETAKARELRMGRVWKNTAAFLNLASLLAALLGVTGIAGAMQLHLLGRTERIATLRCIGVSPSAAFLVYAIQAVGVGVGGGVLGAGAGAFMQNALTVVLSRFILLDVRIEPVWDIAALAVAAAGLVSFLSCTPAFIQLRHLSPFQALRPSVPGKKNTRKETSAWAAYTLAGAGIVLGSLLLAPGESWGQKSVFAAVCCGAFAILSALVTAGIWGTCAMARSGKSYAVRHGLANLRRPQNRSHSVAVALGFSVFVICFAALVQRGFEDKLLQPGEPDMSNVVLVDVRPAQVPAVARLLQSMGLPLLESSPVVSLRLADPAKPAKDEKKHPTSRDTKHESGWLGEYKATWREALTTGEKIAAGEWKTRYAGVGVIPVSVESGLAADMGWDIGTRLDFTHGGRPMKVEIASLRSVDWMQIRPNFHFVFPPGVFDELDGSFMLSTHARNTEQSGQVMAAVSREFPTVSAVDLGLAMSLVDDIARSVRGGARFLAGLMIVVGLAVLLASASASQTERLRECILMRTLGMPSKIVKTIFAVEFVAVGTVASFSGASAALGGAWLVGRYALGIPFAVPVGTLVAVVFAVPLFTWLSGWVITADLLKRSPMDVLRYGQ